MINQPDTKITSLQKLNSFKIEAIGGQGKLNLKLDFEKTSYRGDDPTIILTLHQGLIGSNPYSQQHTFKQSINQGSYDQAQSLLNLIKEKLNLNQTDKQTEKDSRKTQSRNHFYGENKKDRDILRRVIIVTGFYASLSRFEEGTGRNVGRLGAVICSGVDDGKRIRCNVGSGFSDDDRTNIWDSRLHIQGDIMEVRADAVTQNQDGSYSLRFPRFKTFRGFKHGEKL